MRNKMDAIYIGKKGWTHMRQDRFSVLMADLRQSRLLSEDSSQAMQEVLLGAIEYLNQFFSSAILLPVVFSAGDEIQGLFESEAAAFLYYRALSIILGSDSVRGGIGVGDWTTRVRDAPSTMQDGSAYHHARAALDDAKKNRDYTLLFDGDHRFHEKTVLSGYPLSIISSWTSEQARIARYVELCRPLALDRRIHIGSELQHARRALLDALALRCEAVLHAEDRTGEHQLAGRLESEITAYNLLAYVDVQNIDVTAPHEMLYGTRGRGLDGISKAFEGIVAKSRQSVDKSIARARLGQERDATSMVVSVLRGGW